MIALIIINGIWRIEFNIIFGRRRVFNRNKRFYSLKPLKDNTFFLLGKKKMFYLYCKKKTGHVIQQININLKR